MTTLAEVIYLIIRNKNRTDSWSGDSEIVRNGYKYIGAKLYYENVKRVVKPWLRVK